MCLNSQLTLVRACMINSMYPTMHREQQWTTDGHETSNISHHASLQPQRYKCIIIITREKKNNLAICNFYLSPQYRIHNKNPHSFFFFCTDLLCVIAHLFAYESGRVMSWNRMSIFRVLMCRHFVWCQNTSNETKVYSGNQACNNLFMLQKKKKKSPEA